MTKTPTDTNDTIACIPASVLRPLLSNSCSRKKIPRQRVQETALLRFRPYWCCSSLDSCFSDVLLESRGIVKKFHSANLFYSTGGGRLAGLYYDLVAVVTRVRIPPSALTHTVRFDQFYKERLTYRP